MEQTEPINPPTENESDSVLIKATSLQAYFHEMLCEARRAHNFEATPASEHYVVTLLESFAHADHLFGVDASGQRQDKALAMMLHDAVFGEPGASTDHYRRLGDVALYIAGFFADSLRGRSVGVSYYIGMGQGAYSTLSNAFPGSKGRVWREIFAELADTFSRWVEVLWDLSEKMGLSASLSSQGTVELFERLQRAEGSHSQRINTELITRGISPSLGKAWGP